MACKILVILANPVNTSEQKPAGQRNDVEVKT